MHKFLFKWAWGSFPWLQCLKWTIVIFREGKARPGVAEISSFRTLWTFWSSLLMMAGDKSIWVRDRRIFEWYQNPEVQRKNIQAHRGKAAILLLSNRAEIKIPQCNFWCTLCSFLPWREAFLKSHNLKGIVYQCKNGLVYTITMLCQLGVIYHIQAEEHSIFMDIKNKQKIKGKLSKGIWCSPWNPARPGRFFQLE